MDMDAYGCYSSCYRTATTTTRIKLRVEVEVAAAGGGRNDGGKQMAMAMGFGGKQEHPRYGGTADGQGTYYCLW